MAKNKRPPLTKREAEEAMVRHQGSENESAALQRLARPSSYQRMRTVLALSRSMRSKALPLAVRLSNDIRGPGANEATTSIPAMPTK